MPLAWMPSQIGFGGRRELEANWGLAFDASAEHRALPFLWFVNGFVPCCFVSVFSEKHYNVLMNTLSISDILEFPVQERIRLVEPIRDSVAAVPETVEIAHTHSSLNLKQAWRSSRQTPKPVIPVTR